MRVALTIFSLFLFGNLFSQTNTVKVDLFGTVLMATQDLWQPRVSYERVLHKNITAQISLEKGKYFSKAAGSPNSYAMMEYNSVSGYGVSPEIKCYPFTKKKQAPLGLFLSLNYRLLALKETYNKRHLYIDTKGYANNFGINVGFKHGHIFIAEYVLGFGYLKGGWQNNPERNTVPSEEWEEMQSQFGLRIEVNIGFGFQKKN